MKCSKCKDNNKCKAGIIRGIQRYKCKNCNYYYSVEKKSDVKSTETKRIALEMYLEGLGFRAIGRILKISYGTVYQWGKQWGSEVSLVKRKEPIKIVELDEMYTYIQQKKTTVGFGLLLIDMEKSISILSVDTD